MAVHEILPTTNLTGDDIRDTLNANGGSVDNNFLTWFGENSGLNVWSKYKPVISTTLFFSLNLWKSSGYKGDNGKCGLNITTYSVETFKTAAQNGTTGWSYTPPQGGTTQPMRVGDFRGYNPSAVNPLGSPVTNGIITGGYASFAIDVFISGTSETNLTLSDICPLGINSNSLAQYYLGIYMWNSSNSYFYTSGEVIGAEADMNIEIPASAGTYKYIPFLSSVPMTSGVADASAVIVSCNKPSQEVKFVTAGTLKRAIPEGCWNSSYTKVEEIYVTLVNSTPSSVTFTGIIVELRRNKQNDVSASEYVTAVTYDGSVTVAANESKTIAISKTITHSKNSLYPYYWLSAYANETSEVTYQEIEQPIEMALI